MYTRVRELEARTSVVADEKRKQSGVTTKLEKRLSELEGLYASAEEELSHSRKAIIQHEKREKELVVRSRDQEALASKRSRELEQSVELIESLEHRLDQANAEKDDLVRRLGMENAHDLSEMQRSVARVKAERDELMWRKDGLWAAAERLVEDLSDREAHVEAMASEIGFGPIEGIVNRRLSNEARAEAASADYQPYGSYTGSITPQRTPQRAGGEGLGGSEVHTMAWSMTSAIHDAREHGMSSTLSGFSVNSEKKRLHTSLAEFVLAMRGSSPQDRKAVLERTASRIAPTEEDDDY